MVASSLVSAVPLDSAACIWQLVAMESCSHGCARPQCTQPPPLPHRRLCMPMLVSLMFQNNPLHAHASTAKSLHSVAVIASPCHSPLLTVLALAATSSTARCSL